MVLVNISEKKDEYRARLLNNVIIIHSFSFFYSAGFRLADVAELNVLQSAVNVRSPWTAINIQY